MVGSASPRKPIVLMLRRSTPPSSSATSFEVACRSIASGNSSRANAVAVILDRNQPQAAAFDAHRNALGAGVERILHQLLYGGGGPLDHLAGGDAVDGFGGRTRIGTITDPSRRRPALKRACNCGHRSPLLALSPSLNGGNAAPQRGER